MNTPNKLTLIRICLVPIYLLLLYFLQPPYSYLFALIVFAAASFTDMLDGHLARKNNQVTAFGKFLDPLADKVLVISAFIYFIEAGFASSAAVIIIIAREFLVTSLRLVAVSSNGTVIAAGMLGKIKTASQMVSVVAILLLAAVDGFGVLDVSLIANVLVWISAVLTLISGVQYLVQNWKVVTQSK